MEKNLMSKDEASDHSNWNSPQNENQELNPLSQLLLGGNTPLAGSPYSSTSEQEDKLIAMGALFQLQQQQHPQLQQQQQQLQQQQELQQQQQELQQQQQELQQQHLQQQQQQHLQQQQPHQLLQQQLDDKQFQAIEERQQLQLIQEQQRHEREQQEKQRQELMQMHQMQQQNLDNFRIIESASQEEEQSTEKRYQSTVSVLEAAGLLDITLKTSELAQRNEAFEKDLSIFEEVVRATYNAVKGNK